MWIRLFFRRDFEKLAPIDQFFLSGASPDSPLPCVCQLTVLGHLLRVTGDFILLQVHHECPWVVYDFSKTIPERWRDQDCHHRSHQDIVA